MVRNPFSDGLEVEVDSDTAGFRRGLDGAIAKLGSFKKQVGIAGGAVGVLAGGALAKATSAAGTFDDAMTESLAIMGDVSSAMRDKMAGAAREVARRTSFSAEQAADSYYYLASAGLDAAESVASMSDVAEFAQAGMFDMETATDLLTDSASALGIEMDDLSSLGDRFVKANTLANTSVEQIAEAMTNKAAPAMRRMGTETNEGIAALSVFADQGLKGRRAGTIFARTLEGLGKKARENESAFEDLGVSVYDSEGNMRELDQIVEDLEGGLEGMSTQQREAELSQLGFNKRAMQGLDLLIGNSEQLREYESELGDAGGTAQTVAEKQLDTFNKQVGLLKDRLLDVGIVIGQRFLSPMTGLIKRVNAAVERFAQWNDETEGLPATLGLVSAAIGGTITAIAGLTGGFGAAITTTAALTAGLGALLAPVAAVTAAVAGLATAWQKDFAGIRTETRKLVNTTQTALQPVLVDTKRLVSDVTGTFRSAWGDTTSGVESDIGGLVTTIRERLGATIRATTTTASAHVRRFRTKWVQHSDEIEAAISGVIDTVGDVAGKVRSALGPAAAFVRDVFAATWDSAVSGIISTGETLRDLVIDVGTRFGLLDDDTSTAAEALGQLLDPFRKVELAVDGVDKAIRTLSTMWDENWGSIRTTTTEATDAVSGQIGGLESDSTTSIDSIVTSIREDLRAELGRLEKRVGQLRESYGTEFGELATTTRETFGLVGQIVDEILVPIFDRITRVVDRDLGRVNELVDVHLGETISEFTRTLTHLQENVVQPVLKAIMWLWDHYGDEILTTVEITVDTITSIFTIALDGLVTTFRAMMAIIRGDWSEAWNIVAGFFERTLDEILSYGKRWGGALLDWLGGFVDGVVEWFKGLYRRLIGGSVVPDMLEDILGAFKGWGEDLLRWLPGAVSDVVSEFEDLAGDALEEITSVDLYDAGKDMVSDLADGIRDKMPSAKGAAETLAGAVDARMPSSDAETGPLSDITESGPAIPETIAAGMSEQLRDVEQTARDVAKAARPQLDAPVPDVEPAAPTLDELPADVGDQYDIDVVIEGDADARDVDRGLSRALDTHNVSRR